MTTTIAEFRALTTSTILIKSYFLKVIVWMCLFTAAGIHRDVSASSAIQKRTAAQVAASSSIHKVQKEKQRLQPSLALSLPLEIFAFDYFHQKKFPVAVLPRIKKKELLHKKESAASSVGNMEEYRNSTAAVVTRSDFAMMLETDREVFVLTSFAAPYDYFSYPLRLDYVLEETEIEVMQYKEENAHRLLMPSSWIDYVAGCEFHGNCGISFAQGRGDLFLAAGELIIVLLALFSVIVARIVLARTSSYSCHRCKEESPIIVIRKKKLMVMPPLIINCRNHHPHCRCLCRVKTNTFVIPHAPYGYKRVVPTPGAKCGAREYIIARELVQRQHVKPLSPNLKNRPTLDPIPEVPVGYTRVLAPIPGTKCGESDYIVVLVQEQSGKLLHKDDAASSTTNTPSASRKRTSQRIGMRERILPFEQHHQIIECAKDHVRWTMSLTREYPAEFFLYAREITRKFNFLHGIVGECASRLGCYIERIEEEDCIVDHLESLDESNHPSDVHVVDEDDGEDGMPKDVVCNAPVTDVVADSTTCTAARMSGRPTSAPSSAPIEDAAANDFSFQADSSCSDDLKMDVNNDETLQQGGSGYYTDGRGRKRRFSLRILAKKSARRIIKD